MCQCMISAVRSLLVATLLIAFSTLPTGCRCASVEEVAEERLASLKQPAGSVEEAQELARACAQLTRSPPSWEKYDATEWHADAESENGCTYADAGAHIAYWFAWLALNNLHSGFVCTESAELVRSHFTAIERLKSNAPGALASILIQAEELDSSMLTKEGQRVTKLHYDRYLTDYARLLGRKCAPFSEENYTKVKQMLTDKYGQYLAPK